MKKQSLKVSTADPCIFVRRRNGKKLIVAIYVDNGLIAGSDKSEIDVFIDQLRCNFKIMMSTLSNFLGMQTEQCHDGIFMFQRIYMEKVLDRVMVHEANPVAMPCDRSSGEFENSVGSHVTYCEAMGYLMYLMKEHVQTTFAVSQAVRAMDRPTEAEWTDVKRILKYLRGTSNYGLL
jgi:hypothetical protein